MPRHVGTIDITTNASACCWRRTRCTVPIRPAGSIAEAGHSYRGPYQRDRDRIIHSSAFRRLSQKTQVFTGEMGDYHRTRLTHTLEVSSIARTIARALRLNEDLVEALALAHDLGHPPFGHSGEDVLNECLAERRRIQPQRSRRCGFSNCSNRATPISGVESDVRSAGRPAASGRQKRQCGSGDSGQRRVRCSKFK